VARDVEHDPIQIRTATRDPNELTWADRLHREKVPRPMLPQRRTGRYRQELETTPAFSFEQRRRRWWISIIATLRSRQTSRSISAGAGAIAFLRDLSRCVAGETVLFADDTGADEA
jgi:hypothetical protein